MIIKSLALYGTSPEGVISFLIKKGKEIYMKDSVQRSF